MSRRLPLSLAIILSAVLGCGRSSPTAPQDVRQLNGTWEGPLAAYPADEDWSRILLSVQTAGSTMTGTLTSRNGVVHPVSGHTEPAGAVLEIGNLPQRTPCSVALLVERVSSTTIQGSLSGRCPNTLLGDFRLERAR